MTKASLIEFPDRIETPRLYIRPCMPGDGSDVFRAIADSRDALRPWLPFARKEQTLEEVEAGVRESYAEFIKKTDIRLHIYLKETNEFIGSTGLHRIDWDVPKVEIGYWLISQHTKKGYMVEAVNSLTHFALHDLSCQRVEIRCDERNTASRRVPERLGFKLEGILRNDHLDENGTDARDTCVYSFVPEDLLD
ncbi:GNAT family N-acetyltransferase [Rossellomorea vietnamensis]|uniref:GNAT family N-acetyltransferase n=1 Tax=Rossellomorea vietnamensis TaxID=218284 RepID=A0A6I6UTT7_9BACI|nr:GNAT family N-acetyltransferase [Rossellomorea vietnamensis]QHE62070.1 GNAT family N-acetyltransferase [Rossellomorea vietnamensis]